jgi:ATP-dependent helicase/nuclease subunit B
MILTKSLEKSIDLDFEIDRIIKSNQLESLLLIVPTNRKSRYLKKEIISLSSSDALSTINVETIGTFSTKIFFCDQKISSKVLSESASSVLLRQSFQEVKTKYFSNYSDEIPSGTLDRIRNVISEYKKQGTVPGTLKIESRNLKSSEKNKAEDIAEIYSNYQEKIKQLNVNEIGDIYSALIQNSPFEFTEKLRSLYPKVDLIIINGFDEFTTPEIEIIDLISIISNSRLFLTFDYYKFNPLIFSHLEKCYSKLIKKGFREIDDRSPASFDKFRLSVRENLFLKKPVPLEKQNSFIDKLTFIQARNRETEIELTAKEIKDLITKKKVEPHKICIAFNLIQKYSPIIRDIFSLYGLPFNLTDRFSLSSSSPVTALINFLEILENDYFYKNIFRALSSGYINISGVDLSSLLKASKELKILSGYERWTAALNGALSHKIEEDPFERFSNNKESFTKALNSLQTLYSYLKDFKGKQTIKEFRDRLMNLIFKLKIPANLINDESGEVEKNIKAVNTFVEIINEVLNLLEEEHEQSEKFNLKFFLNQIRTAVISARYNIKEKPGFGVQVTTLNEIRGLEFDYLFICGMCDGDLPTRYAPEIFFSGSYSRYEENHQTEERYHFYQSLCSWKKALYLTYPLSEERKELAQSNFLIEFRNLFNVNEKFENDFKNTLYSREEILELAGIVDTSLLIEKYGKEKISIDADDIENAKKINNLRRDEMFGDSPFVGDIYQSLKNEDKDWLKDFKFRQYSISQLETYAKCPYKYFAERILKLEEIEEPTEEVEALEMGSLLHNIFYEFYKRLKVKGIIFYKCSDNEFSYAKELLFSIAEKKIDEANFKSPLSFYEREKILGLNNQKENSILFEFLKQERINTGGFVPEFLEVSFGRIDKENLPDSVKNLKARGVLIRGKIDRVDLNPDEKTFRVIDYKLGGKRPTKEELQDGISLQLPLYIYAAKELIKAQLNKDYEAAGADIYSLKFRKDKFGRLPVKDLSSDKTTTENLINICLESVEKYVELISTGKFHLTQLNDRENKVCRFCSFRSICRIEENN